jgi:hypothetical protein
MGHLTAGVPAVVVARKASMLVHKVLMVSYVWPPPS